MMRVYFKDGLQEQQGFVQEDCWYDKKPSKKHKFHGVEVFPCSNGKWGSYALDQRDRVPEVVLSQIDYVTENENLPAYPLRETGNYRLEEAAAEGRLTKVEGGYFLEMRGATPNGIVALSSAVRAGLIRPYESFEGEQAGLSRRELEMKLEQAERTLRQREATLEMVREWLRQEQLALAEIAKNSVPLFSRVREFWEDFKVRWSW